MVGTRSGNAKRIAESIVHPYFLHETADALEMIRRKTKDGPPETEEVSWESEHSDLGHVSLTYWGQSVNGPWGVRWANFDGHGSMTSTEFVPEGLLDEVAAQLREL